MILPRILLIDPEMTREEMRDNASHGIIASVAATALVAAIVMVIFVFSTSRPAKAETFTQVSEFSAKKHKHHHRKRRGGFNCGNYMMGLTGARCGSPLALGWLACPRTSPAPGAVVVQHRRGRALGGGPGGHVSQIVSLISSCRAIVRDNRGTYERDICKNGARYVSPS